jgi:predicted ester cyclase
MTEHSQYIEIIQTYLQQAVAQGDTDILDRLFEPDAVSYGLKGQEPVLGLEGQRGFIVLLHRTLGDINVTIEDIIAADKKVAVRFMLSGTTTADTIVPRVGDRFVGRLTLPSHAVYHFAHGRIRDSWTVLELSKLPVTILIPAFLGAMTAYDKGEELGISLEEEEALEDLLDEELEDLLDEEL